MLQTSRNPGLGHPATLALELKAIGLCQAPIGSREEFTVDGEIFDLPRNLTIREGYKGAGLGRFIMQRAIEWARQLPTQPARSRAALLTGYYQQGDEQNVLRRNRLYHDCGFVIQRDATRSLTRASSDTVPAEQLEQFLRETAEGRLRSTPFGQLKPPVGWQMAWDEVPAGFDDIKKIYGAHVAQAALSLSRPELGAPVTPPADPVEAEPSARPRRRM